jgi:hypothetical protein
MPTIPEIANQIATTHGVDRHAAIDVVRTYVDQIADDPDLWNADAEELTAAGTELVVGAIDESHRQGLFSTDASILLQQIEIAEQERANLKQQAREALIRRDELVRRAFATELPRDLIATAAGINKARIYQIRDGRR